MTARLWPVLTIILVALGAVALAGPATAASTAASPQVIYEDLADNGKLDGQYSRADIARAFNLERVIRTDARRPAPKRRPAAAVPRTEPATPSGRGVPFTGLDLALLTLGGGPVLLIGLALRRRLSTPARAARVARA